MGANEKDGKVAIVVASVELGHVKGRIEATIGDDKSVSARLESLEDTMKNLCEKISQMDSKGVQQSENAFPALGAAMGSSGSAAVIARNVSMSHGGYIGSEGNGGTHPSYASSAKGLARPTVVDTNGSENSRQNDNDGFRVVGTRRKKTRKEFSTGTSNVRIEGVDGPLQPSHQHFVGNTPGSMSEDTLVKVLKELAAPLMAQEGIEGTLEVEQCNLLTIEENFRTRVWRVVVPHKYSAILKDDRMYPTGWRHREFEGQYRPPLTPEQRAERDSRRKARRDNDGRLDTFLRQLAGSTQKQQ